MKYAHDKFDVNTLACICAIDKAVLTVLMEYWIPEVRVAGIHEFVGNALVMKGEKDRTTDLRGEPLPNLPPEGGESAEGSEKPEETSDVG